MTTPSSARSHRRQSRKQVSRDARDAPQLPFTSARSDAHRLREAISVLDSQIEALVLQRNQLELHLERAVHVQSPVHRVPPEILGKIFEFGLQGEDEHSSPLMVYAVLLVCRFWRDVAIETPTLWTRISVTPHDNWKRVRLRLERSKASPLHVLFRFDSRGSPTSTMMEKTIHAMDLIRPALWRVKTFHLVVPSKLQAHAILVRCKEPAPLLETLSIEIEHALQDERGTSPVLPLFNGHTPRLRSCSFTSFNFGWDLGLVSNLRTLNLGGYITGAPSPDTVLQILRNCPALEELSLQNLSAFDGGMFFPKDEISHPTLVKPLCLPRLRRASFYYSGITLTTHIINSTSFPALESLELYYLEDVTPILRRLHELALTRLPLKRLRVVSCGFDELQFASVLRKVPSLTSLELVAIEDVSCVLLKTLSTTSPVACPKLKALVLDQCTNYSWDSLRTFVETRFFLATKSLPPSQGGKSSASAAAAAHSWVRSMPYSALPPPCRLHTIDITQCSQIGKEMIQWLKMYVPEVISQPGGTATITGSRA